MKQFREMNAEEQGEFLARLASPGAGEEAPAGVFRDGRVYEWDPGLGMTVERLLHGVSYGVEIQGKALKRSTAPQFGLQCKVLNLRAGGDVPKSLGALEGCILAFGVEHRIDFLAEVVGGRLLPFEPDALPARTFGPSAAESDV